MIALPIEFNRSHFHYRQIWREKDVAVFEYDFRGGSFELIIIRVEPATRPKSECPLSLPSQDMKTPPTEIQSASRPIRVRPVNGGDRSKATPTEYDLLSRTQAATRLGVGTSTVDRTKEMFLRRK
jgi:hypothetical protein